MWQKHRGAWIWGCRASAVRLGCGALELHDALPLQMMTHLLTYAQKSSLASLGWWELSCGVDLVM